MNHDKDYQKRKESGGRGRGHAGGRNGGRGRGHGRGRGGGRGRGQPGGRGGGRNNGFSSALPLYIQQLIKFSKKEIEFSNIEDATNNGFLNIARQVNLTPCNEQYFNGRSLAMLFTGTKRYKIKFHHWETNQALVWNLLKAFTPFTNSQEIANILNSLSKMREGLFHVMDKDLQKTLLDAIDRNVDDNRDPFNSQNIANTLLALNQMGLKWNTDDLSVDLQRKLLDAIDRNVDDNRDPFNSQDIANTLLALVEMHIWIADLFVLQLTKKLMDQVRKYLERGEFVIEEKDQVARALTWLLHTEYCVSSTTTTIATSTTSLGSCIEEAKGIEIGLSNFLDECRSLAQDLTESHYNAEVTANITISNLQKDVFTCLKLVITNNTNPNQISGLREEYRLGVSNCVSVDIFIPPGLRYNDYEVSAEKKGTVIEVNGPPHFSIMDRESNRYEYNIQTLKKKELLEAMGYMYIDIPYNEWSQLKRNSDAKISYLKNKLQV